MLAAIVNRSDFPQRIARRESTVPTVMTRLNEATERLMSALDRLDQAVENRAKVRANGEGASDDAELRAALAAARKENETLQNLAGEVSSRLDSTIARLKSVMEA